MPCNESCRAFLLSGHGSPALRCLVRRCRIVGLARLGCLRDRTSGRRCVAIASPQPLRLASPAVTPSRGAAATSIRQIRGAAVEQPGHQRFTAGGPRHWAALQPGTAAWRDCSVQRQVSAGVTGLRRRRASRKTALESRQRSVKADETRLLVRAERCFAVTDPAETFLRRQPAPAILGSCRHRRGQPMAWASGASGP